MFRKPLAAAALLALTSHAANATLPTVGRALGNAIRAHFLNNETIGKAGYAVMFRGRSPAAACYSSLQAYMIADTDRQGYAAGTGGIIRVRVLTLGGRPVGGAATWTPRLVDGKAPADSHELFHTYALDVPACLAAGQGFGVVFDNVDPDPAANWMGVEAIAARGPRQFPALEPVWAVLMREGGHWVKREPPFSADVPIMQLCATGGACVSQTYMQNGGDQPVGGAAMARQLLTPTADGSIRRCHIDAARGNAATARVRVSLTTPAGATLAAVDAEARSLPVGSGLDGAQLGVTFPEAVAVKAGRQIALQISAATPGAIRVAPVRDGVGYFTRPGGWGGATDFAQYKAAAATAWEAWPGQSTLSDLSAYCEP